MKRRRMFSRMLPVVVVRLLMGCSHTSDPVDVPAQVKSEAEARKAAEPEEPVVGVDKCRKYRVPPFCERP